MVDTWWWLKWLNYIFLGNENGEVTQCHQKMCWQTPLVHWPPVDVQVFFFIEKNTSRSRFLWLFSFCVGSFGVEKQGLVNVPMFHITQQKWGYRLQQLLFPSDVQQIPKWWDIPSHPLILIIPCKSPSFSRCKSQVLPGIFDVSSRSAACRRDRAQGLATGEVRTHEDQHADGQGGAFARAFPQPRSVLRGFCNIYIGSYVYNIWYIYNII